MGSRLCRACGIRWEQEGGTCRRCKGQPGRTRRTPDMAIPPQLAFLQKQRRHQQPPPRQPLYTVVVQGEALDVMWNGAVRP